MRDLINDSSTAAIVNSILDLARQLNLDCVAEGVETAAQLEHLRLNRCPGIQGFYFSQGVEMENVPAILRNTIPTASLLTTLPQQRCA